MHRYTALHKVLMRVHSFRTKYINPDTDEEIIGEYNDIIRGLQREMNLISFVDNHPLGWQIAKEMQHETMCDDGDLIKAATRAEARIKAHQPANERGRAPFRRGGRGSATSRGGGQQPQFQYQHGYQQPPAAPHQFQLPGPHLQWPPATQFPHFGAAQTYGIRYSDFAPPAPYATVQPRYPQPVYVCFLCHQPGHFRKSCPLNPAAKAEQK